MSKNGNVLNIQRFTIHDGPGLRTELFLKGCPLRCAWCGNPESFKTGLEMGVYRSKCISKEKCGSCAEVCKAGDVLIFSEGKLSAIDRSMCTNCFACHEACPSDAIKKWGEVMSVEDCMKVICKDKGYYERSGGGVTVSGGEPLLQSDFVAEIFKACKKEGIHTCLESSFYGEWKEIEKILPYTDLIITDLKLMDSDLHYKYTKVRNEKILENLKRLAQENRTMILRIPVIPEVNDDMENIEATADFILDELGESVRTLQLLSFMRLGEEKYASLGMPYGMKKVKIDREAFQKKVDEIGAYFRSRGIHCQVGTKEKS